MNLKVKIPKKFKATLSKRFNYKQSLVGFSIKKVDIMCPLCEVSHTLSGGCGGCPFEKFTTQKSSGCYVWFNRVIPHRSFNIATSIWWQESKDREVKEQLSLLRKKAKELIEWV